MRSVENAYQFQRPMWKAVDRGLRFWVGTAATCTNFDVLSERRFRSVPKEVSRQGLVGQKQELNIPLVKQEINIQVL